MLFVRFGSVRFGSVRFGSVRFDSVQIGSIRFGPIRFGSVCGGSIRFGKFEAVRVGSVGSNSQVFVPDLFCGQLFLHFRYVCTKYR